MHDALAALGLGPADRGADAQSMREAELTHWRRVDRELRSGPSTEIVADRSR